MNFFMPQVVVGWEILETQGMPKDFKLMDFMGNAFVPIFTSEADARKYFPNTTIVELNQRPIPHEQ